MPVAQLIINIIFVILGAAWLGWCLLEILHGVRSHAPKSGMPAHVRCEICGTEYFVSAAEFWSSPMLHARIGRAAPSEDGTVREPDYTYYVKAFHCPTCRKRRYAAILNLEELETAAGRTTKASVYRWILIMAAGGAVLLLAQWGVTSLAEMLI